MAQGYFNVRGQAWDKAQMHDQFQKYLEPHRHSSKKGVSGDKPDPAEAGGSLGDGSWGQGSCRSQPLMLGFSGMHVMTLTDINKIMQPSHTTWFSQWETWPMSDLNCEAR